MFYIIAIKKTTFYLNDKLPFILECEFISSKSLIENHFEYMIVGVLGAINKHSRFF